MSAHTRTQDWLGPPSDRVDLQDFRDNVAPSLAHAALPGTESSMTSHDTPQALRERCSVADLASKTAATYKKHSYMRDARAWLMARMCLGKDDPWSVTEDHAAASTKPSSTKRKKRRVDDNDNDADDLPSEAIATPPPGKLDPSFVEDQSRILDSPLRQAHVPTNVKHFMRQTRQADLNVLSDLLCSPDDAATSGPQPFTSEDLMITLTLFPVSNTSSKHTVTTNAQTMHFPASSKLSVLRDHMICSADDTPTIDSATGRYTATRMNWPSIVLIENVLYPDNRVTTEDDNDSPEKIRSFIENFVEEHNNRTTGRPIEQSYVTPNFGRNVRRKKDASSNVQQGSREETPNRIVDLRTPPSLSSDGMEEVSWSSLSLRLGEIYWFHHAGNCEHLFVIDSIRIIHPNDPRPSPLLRYPVSSLLSRTGTPKCRVCEKDPVAFITVDDEIAGDSPALMCQTCFRLLHGSPDFEQSGPANRNMRIIPLLSQGS